MTLENASIPHDCVAPRLHIPDMRTRRALPCGRLHFNCHNLFLYRANMKADELKPFHYKTFTLYSQVKSMEGLRIRIPTIGYCSTEKCIELTRRLLCMKCLHARMCKEVTPATLPRKTEVVHCPPLSGYFSC